MGLIIMDTLPACLLALRSPRSRIISLIVYFSLMVGFSFSSYYPFFVEMSEEVFSLLPPCIFLLIYIAGVQLGRYQRVVGFQVLILGPRGIFVVDLEVFLS